MKKYLADIREKTSQMSKKEACEYILTYYWYHILIIFSITALILLFGVHYAFGNKKPLFTCALVNQEQELLWDQELTEGFAAFSGLPDDRIVIDSDYNFSYGDVKLEGVNESSYEKFFFQWQNGELDAVILPESFYHYVKEMGGRFRTLTEEETEGFTVYMDGEACTAVVLEAAAFTERAVGKSGERQLLAFPGSGKHTEESMDFLKYMRIQFVKGGV